MAAINLGTLRRPNTASIFRSDPATLGSIVSVILQDVAISGPNRVRLDLMKSASVNRRSTVARSPIERFVGDNIQIEPASITVTGSLSATPLGPIASRLGGFGSIVRRDLIEMRRLYSFQDLGEPCVLVLPMRIYPSVAITNIAETGNGANKVDVAITFEEIQIINPLTVAGALDLDAILAGSATTTNAGAQGTTEVVADVGGGLG